jgi:hypothetical protein
MSSARQPVAGRGGRQCDLPRGPRSQFVPQQSGRRHAVAQPAGAGQGGAQRCGEPARRQDPRIVADQQRPQLVSRDRAAKFLDRPRPPGPQSSEVSFHERHVWPVVPILGYVASQPKSLLGPVLLAQDTRPRRTL